MLNYQRVVFLFRPRGILLQRVSLASVRWCQGLSGWPVIVILIIQPEWLVNMDVLAMLNDMFCGSIAPLFWSPLLLQGQRGEIERGEPSVGRRWQSRKAVESVLNWWNTFQFILLSLTSILVAVAHWKLAMMLRRNRKVEGEVWRIRSGGLQGTMHGVHDVILRKPWWFMFSYPLVNVNKKRWKDPPFFMGKSTISMVIFNSYVKLPEGILIFKNKRWLLWSTQKSSDVCACWCR